MLGEGDHEIYCHESSPGCVTGVFWAVPVKPDLLGSRLEAYAVTKKCMHTVRLCNRLGNNPAGIAKLPAEILNMIEECVQAPLRDQFEKEWSALYDCVSGACEPEDHFTQEDLSEFELSLRMELGCDCGCGDVDCDIDCETLQDELLESHETHHVHAERSHEWATRVNQVPAHGQTDDGNFVKLDRILKQHFGLEAFWTGQRLDNEESCFSFHQAPFAYLILPGKSTSNVVHINEYGVSMTSSLMLPLDILTPLTPNDAAKFNSALSKLGLTPWISPLQIRQEMPSGRRGRPGSGPKDSAKDRLKRVQDLLTQKWPQRMVLVKAHGHHGS